MVRPLPLVVLLAFASSCSSREPAPSPPSAGPVTAPSPAPAPATPTPAPPAAVPAKAPAPTQQERLAALRGDTKLREASRAAARELAEGRRLAKAGQLAESLAAMQRALAADASNVAIQCEAGFVAFRAERLDDAERHLAAALGAPATREAPPERLRETVAMCLYNRARVWEARGAQAEAVADLRASLRLRPNQTVSARLAALESTAAAPAPPPAAAAPAWPRRFDTLAAAEAFAITDPHAGPDDEPDRRRRIQEDQKATSAVDPRIEAHLWKIVTGEDEYTGSAVMFLALATPRGVLVWGDIAGAHGNGGDVRGGLHGDIAFEQLVPGGPDELRGEILASVEDVDAGANEVWGFEDEVVLLCGAGANEGWSCVGLPVKDRTGSEWYDAESLPPRAPERPSPPEGYAIEWSLQDGALVLENPEGAPTRFQDRGRLVLRLLGRHPVAEVLATEGLPLGGISND